MIYTGGNGASAVWAGDRLVWAVSGFLWFSSAPPEFLLGWFGAPFCFLGGLGGLACAIRWWNGLIGRPTGEAVSRRCQLPSWPAFGACFVIPWVTHGTALAAWWRERDLMRRGGRKKRKLLWIVHGKCCILAVSCKFCLGLGCGD